MEKQTSEAEAMKTPTQKAKDKEHAEENRRWEQRMERQRLPDDAKKP